MNAYMQCLNGRQAAWAARKYKGHRVLPNTIIDEIEKVNILQQTTLILIVELV
jgi:hypothetical protein